MNKGVANQLVLGGIIQQPYEVSQLLDCINKINKASCTREDQMYPITLRMTKSKSRRIKRELNMAK